MKEKAEDENEDEDEDEGCRRGRASAADRRLFRAEHAEGLARASPATQLRIADCGLKITAGRSPHEEFFAAGEEMYG
jgi:hypothetical protein